MSEWEFKKAKHLEEVKHNCNLCNQDVWECDDCGVDFKENEEIICVTVGCLGQYERHEDKGSNHFCKNCARKKDPEEFANIAESSKDTKRS